VVITGWEAWARAVQAESEPRRISHRMHLIQFRQIMRDAEIAHAISPVVRRHRLTEEETEKFLLELRIPRAENVAQITDRLIVSCSQKASAELAARSWSGESRLWQRSPVTRVCSLNSIYEIANCFELHPTTKWIKP
jgi:hypothetical protein